VEKRKKRRGKGKVIARESLEKGCRKGGINGKALLLGFEDGRFDFEGQEARRRMTQRAREGRRGTLSGRWEKWWR